MSFNYDGTPFDPGTFVGGFLQIGGDGSLTDLYNDDLLPDLDRYTFNTSFRYDLNSHVRAFAEFKFTHIDTYFTAQPTYDYGLYIPLDNPYIPAAAVTDARQF